MTRHPGRRRFGLLVVVGLLGAFGPFGTDMYLPALPQLVSELGASDVEAQLTIVVYLVGLGIGQLVWGPLSDRIGRRIPILIGTIGFALVSIACALAPSMAVLIPMRLIQGLLGAAGIVISRAVVRDLYSGDDLARILSRLTIVFGLAPVIAPIIGGLLLTFTDWRGTFVALIALGGLLTAAAAIWVRETLPPERRIRDRDSARGDAWRALARSPQFIRYTVVAVVTMIALFAYITSISLVLQGEWGLDATAFSIWFAVNALAGILGGQVGGALLGRISSRRMLPVAIGGLALAGLIVILAALGDRPFWLLEIGLLLTMFCFTLAAPLATALALGPFERGAGTAAAALGASQFIAGALAPVAVALAFGTSTLVMGSLILAASLLAIGLALPRRRR